MLKIKRDFIAAWATGDPKKIEVAIWELCLMVAKKHHIAEFAADIWSNVVLQYRGGKVGDANPYSFLGYRANWRAADILRKLRKQHPTYGLEAPVENMWLDNIERIDEKLDRESI